MYSLKWPSGHVDSAPTWAQLEITLFKDQIIVPSKTPEEFRQDMQHRARMWSNTDIDIAGSSKEFIDELIRARLCERIFSQ